MEQLIKYTILFTILVSLTSNLNADTYKWIDEEGVVTYSQTPPPRQGVERVKIRGAKSGSDESSARLDQLRQRLADSAEDRQIAKQQREEAKAEEKRKRQNCEAARSNLRKLEGLGNRLYQTEGEYRRLSEEERQSLMQKEREHIKANCES
jgi:hypothetical protein